MTKTVELFDWETDELLRTLQVSEKDFIEDFEWCLNEPEKHPFGPDSNVKWAVWRLKGDT